MLEVRESSSCELCNATDVVVENALAYWRYDNHALSPGHILVVPKRHVPSFFDMSAEEQMAVLQLLGAAQRHVQLTFSPAGYNIGVNVGVAAGQTRMHVHVHLIPRYPGDVPDPRGGIRCVLSGSQRAA
jgi:diadenosine tetraphosphate (Ap4A) HIT family hydrolase